MDGPFGSSWHCLSHWPWGRDYICKIAFVLGPSLVRKKAQTPAQVRVQQPTSNKESWNSLGASVQRTAGRCGS